jgi:hypothetical protein
MDLRRRTEIIPIFLDPHTRMKSLALASGHSPYITVTPERALVSVGEWPLHITVVNLKPFHFRNGCVTAVSHLKPPCGGFRSETATWIQKHKEKSVGTSRGLSLDIVVFQVGDDERGYRNMYREGHRLRGGVLWVIIG